MRKTFADLIIDKPGESDGWQTTYTFSTILELMTEVREATIQECQILSKLKYLAGETGYLSKESVLQLDKNSIEIYEI